MSLTTFASPPEDAVICTVADVHALLGIPAADTSRDAELANLTFVATDMIESWCNRPIVPKAMPAESHDGWSGDTIMLFYTPVVSIQSVTEYWSTGGAHVLSEVSPSTPGDGYQAELRTGRLIRTFDGQWPMPWFPGSRNVIVNYTAGFSTMPPAIWQAARELVRHIWIQQEQLNPANVPKFSGAPERAADNRPDMWESIPMSVQAKLKPYRSQSIA